MPSSAAFRAAASAATWAANGVPLREPLNPTAPALDQVTTFPCGSLIVMIVLLNVEWMWTTPSDTIRLAFLRRGGPPPAAGGAGVSPGTSPGLSLFRFLLPLLRGGFFSLVAGRGPLSRPEFVWLARTAPV